MASYFQVSVPSPRPQEIVKIWNACYSLSLANHTRWFIRSYTRKHIVPSVVPTTMCAILPCDVIADTVHTEEFHRQCEDFSDKSPIAGVKKCRKFCLFLLIIHINLVFWFLVRFLFYTPRALVATLLSCTVFALSTMPLVWCWCFASSMCTIQSWS